MTVTRNDAESRYEIVVDGEVAGMLVYRERGRVLTLVHTEVGDEHEGQGVGSRLVQGALEDIRSRGLEIRPLCPFVVAYLKRHPEYADLVSSDA